MARQRAASRYLAHLALVLIFSSSSPAVAEGKPPSAKAILDGADARIEKHRKGDAVVNVLDAAGKPVAGATVRADKPAAPVSQTRQPPA